MTPTPTMTNDQIRERIAEICGYKPCQHCLDNGYSGQWRTPDDRDCVTPENLPNYPESLDAMHEAEKTLTAYNKQQMAYHLWVIITAPAAWRHEHSHEIYGKGFFGISDMESVLTATALQRCLAFLAVHGVAIK